MGPRAEHASESRYPSLRLFLRSDTPASHDLRPSRRKTIATPTSVTHMRDDLHLDDQRALLEQRASARAVKLHNGGGLKRSSSQQESPLASASRLARVMFTLPCSTLPM